MTRAGIAFGSNIPDRLRHLTMARMMIGELSAAQLPMLSSKVYETEPIECEPNASYFLNGVIEIGWDGDAQTLHHALRKIESDLGRPAAHERNTSRKIDLDLLYFGDTQMSAADLKLPHPRLHERRFVLQPLADIRPEFVLPLQSETVGDLLSKLIDEAHVVPADSQW